MSRIIFALVLLVCFVAAQHKDIQLEKVTVGEVQALQYSYYRLESAPALSGNKLSILLTPYAGDGDLYISQGTDRPNRNVFDWKSTQAGRDIVVISQDDPKYRAGQALYIGVEGFKNPAEFALTAHLSDGHIELVDGTPQFNNVEQGKFTYFKYYLTDPGEFSITISTINGDPDIYVHTNITKPDGSNYYWKHEDWGSDILTIKPGDNGYVAPGWYYIGIKGYTESQFDILVSHRETISILPVGLPLFQFVDTADWVYFKFKLLIRETTKFTLSKASYEGDPDMYISRYHEYPNEWEHEWAAIGVDDEDYVIIPKEETTAPQWYYIGVKGYRKATFRLHAASDDIHTTLLSGRNLVGHIEAQHKYTYFKYYYDDNDENALDIQVIPRFGGRVQIYVSEQEGNRYPTKENYDYAGTEIGNGASIFLESPTHRQWYYIAVYARDDEVDFNIVAAPRTHQIELQTGITNYYSANSESGRDFYYDVDDPNVDVTISVFQYWGAVDVYMAPWRPTPTNYTWSARSNSWQVINVSPSDPHRQKQGRQRFHILVQGRRDYNSFYTIVAHTSDVALELIHGAPFSGVVAEKQYKYYKFYVGHESQVTLNLRASGSTGETRAAIFVSPTIPKPDDENYSYRSRNVGGAEFATFPVYKGEFPQYWYASVYGYVNTSYQIVFAMDHQVMAPDGISIFDTTQQGTWRYYSTIIQEQARGSEMFVGLTLLSGYTEMYLMDNGTLPTRRVYKYYSGSFPGNAIKIDKLSSVGTWYIGVYASIHSEYLLSVSTQTWQSVLTQGSPQIAEIGPELSYFYTWGRFQNNETYSFAVKDNAVNPRATFTVYISQTHRPNETHHQWKFSSTDYAVIDIPKNEVQNGRAFMFAIRASAKINVMLTFSRESVPQALTQTTQHERKLFANSETKYKFFSSLDSTMVKAVLESCDDLAVPVFYMSRTLNQRGRPSTSNHAYHQEFYTEYGRSIDQTEWYMTVPTGPSHSRVVSIYANTIYDRRPAVKNPQIWAGEVIGSYTQKHFTLTIPKAESTSGWNSNALRYFIYKRVMNDPNKAINTLNFHTACGVKTMGILMGEARYDPDSKAPEIKYTANIDKDEEDKGQTLVINVLVRDFAGRAQVYTPIKVKIPPGAGPNYAAVPVAIVATIILLIGLAAAGYIIIGVLVKKLLYKQEGLDVIPNIGFWKKICGCCCARARYARFDDNTVNVTKSETTVPTGGYGSL